MGKVVEINHPLVQHKLSMLRDEKTGPKEFRELVMELSMLIAYEATRDMETQTVTVKTPIAEAQVETLANRHLAVVPILRAGLGMADGMMNILPKAKMGHIGLFRNEKTLKPVNYYCKLPPDISEREALLVDPMLATGNSAVEGIRILKEAGAKSVRLCCIIGAPEGVRAVQEAYPDVSIYICHIDSGLNEKGYIVPGLGDAGDRLFGTV